MLHSLLERQVSLIFPAGKRKYCGIANPSKYISKKVFFLSRMNLTNISSDIYNWALLFCTLDIAPRTLKIVLPKFF